MGKWLGGATLALALLVMAGPVLGGGKGTVVDLDGLTSTTPDTWKTKPGAPASQFRLYTLLLPKGPTDEADPELQITFFGKGGGGGLDANVQRWQGMFEAPEGKKIDDVTKTDKFKVGKAEVVVVDISGTYLEKFPPFAPNAKTIRRPDYRRINVFMDSENGPFFMNLTGPAKTIERNMKDFNNWLRAFK